MFSQVGPEKPLRQVEHSRGAPVTLSHTMMAELLHVPAKQVRLHAGPKKPAGQPCGVGVGVGEGKGVIEGWTEAEAVAEKLKDMVGVGVWVKAGPAASAVRMMRVLDGACRAEEGVSELQMRSEVAVGRASSI